MSESDHYRGPHDLGGRPAGPVSPTTHPHEPWEKRVDAIMKVLADDRRRIIRTDEMRRAIESLGPDAYARLSYYERWAAAAAALVVEKGLLTREAIDARVARLRAARESAP